MTKRNRKPKSCSWYGSNYWQSSDFNERSYLKNISLLESLAINRFRWVGLPNTCDARYLEQTLLRSGIATICHDKDLPDVWQNLQAIVQGDFNAYGVPVSWRAMGFDSRTQYEVTGGENGELVYYSFSRINPWNALQLFARKMTHYERTEDINLAHQHRPFILSAPKEKKLEIENIYKQIAGGEPAIIGTDKLRDLTDNITSINTDVPLLVEQLAQGWQNCLHNALLYLGIPHLAFEKGERMIEDEARANTAPTNIMLLDCLQARRQTCDILNSRYNLDVHVYFNDDFESYNFNYSHSLEAVAQDKLIIDGALSLPTITNEGE